MTSPRDERLRALPTRRDRAYQFLVEASDFGPPSTTDMMVAFAEFEMAGVPSEMDDEVAAFHGKFAHPAPSAPTLQSQSTLEFRCKLIREEAEELCDALMARDLPAIAAEAIDLLYVTFGTLVVCGLRARPFWRLVHRANMLKEPNPDGGKPLKPEGWIKPDCGSLIGGFTDLDWPATARAQGREEGWPMFDRTCGDDL